MECKITDKATFYAVKDCMNSIQKVNAEDFVRDFPTEGASFSQSLDPIVFNIYTNLAFDCHSGASYACTLRECQYFLLNPNEWETVQEYWRSKTD